MTPKFWILVCYYEGGEKVSEWFHGERSLAGKAHEYNSEAEAQAVIERDRLDGEFTMAYVTPAS